jgi:hypothetical protein
MHPNKKEASDALNAKMRRMTAHYVGSPVNNIKPPSEHLKGEAMEDHVGLGADSANETAKRGDRPARRAMAANPVPTYKKGGRVKKRDDGGSVSSIEAANKAEAEAEPAEKAAGGVIARARGGRANKKGSTHVNVVVAPQGGPQASPPAIPPQLAGAMPKPPMAPPAPPAGGPPMMPPGAGGPPPGAPPMPMRAKGGKVMGDHPDAAQDKDLIEKTLREEGLVRKARGGGITMTAGAITGLGRLEKMGEGNKAKAVNKVQEV